MLMNFKQWLSEYKGPEYDHALPFGNLRLSTKRLFWKSGMKLCALEMERNENDAVPTPAPELSDEPLPLILYCRACEFACKVREKRENKEEKKQ